MKAIRIFDIRGIARCVAAMFLDKPEIASRYPTRLTGEMRNQVYNPAYQEELFYVAAYTLYRLKILISNKRIEQRYYKARWHILMAIKYYVWGDSIPNLTSQKVKKTCSAIENFMSSGDEETVRRIKDLCTNVIDIDEVTRDKLKGSALVQDVKTKALEFRKTNPSK